jgi:exosortase family protein XrtM
MNHRTGLRFIAIFLLVFAGLQWLMIRSEGTAIERLVIDRATVGVAAIVTGFAFPQDAVRAQNYTLVSSRVRLNVLRGCEGTELLFLVIAGALASPAQWRSRLTLMGVGLVLAYVLNQLRIVALYATVRDARAHFELVHAYIAPTLLVVVIVVFFWAWTTRQVRIQRSVGSATPAI